MIRARESPLSLEKEHEALIDGLTGTTSANSDLDLERIVARLAPETDPIARDELLRETCAAGHDLWPIAERLKLEADRMRYLDIQASLAWSATIEQLGLIARADSIVALAKMTEALTVFEQDRYAESIELFDQASSLFQLIGHDLGWARAQIARTSACVALGRFDEALLRAEEARTILVTSGDDRRVAALDNNVAVLLERMNRPAAAIEYGERALAYFLRTEDGYHAAHVLSNHALLLWRLGKVRQALETHAQARDRYTAAGAAADALREDVNSGGILLVLGRYAEARTVLSSSRRQLLLLSANYQAARAGTLLVECCVRMGRYSEAIAAASGIEQELAVFDATADVLGIAVWHCTALAEEGRTSQAIETLNRAARLAADQPGFASYMAVLDLARARLLRSSGQTVAATELLDSTIPALGELGLELEAASAKILHSHLLLDQSRCDDAFLAASEAATIADRGGIEWLAAHALHARARAERRQGLDGAARSTLSLAVWRLDRVQQVTAWDDRAAFTNTTAAIFEEAVELALSRREYRLALYYVERAKARALADHLKIRSDIRPRAGDAQVSALVEELSELREQLAWSQAVRRRHDSAATLKTHQYEANGRSMDSSATIEARIAAIWRELQAANPVYRRQAAALDVRDDREHDDDTAASQLLQAITEETDRDVPTALLEYFGVGGDIVIFVVFRGSLKIERIPGACAETQRLVTLLRLNISRSASAVAGGGAVSETLARNARGILARLYDLLIRPAAGHLAGAARLVIVPHGVMHHVPFHALYDGERYLIEDHEVSYSPSADLLSHFAARHGGLPDPGPGERQSIVFAYARDGRLPHVEVEGRWVADVLTGRLCRGAEASIAAFQSDATKCGIVHIAAHGDFNPEEPMLSSLDLYDGQLSTLDVFEMELNCSLVTLSACETALGVTGAGDELMGLSRAFLFAGAPSLVLSLWMVDDRSTAALMREFYIALCDGQSKAAALRRAQLSLLRNQVIGDTDVSSPFFWAPFQLIGHAGRL
jgi:CHAT domain-containing protein